MDPWVGLGSCYKLSKELRDILSMKRLNLLGDCEFISDVIEGRQNLISIEYFDLNGEC